MKEVRLEKQLQSQLNTILADVEATKIELNNKQLEYNQKLEAVKRLKQELKKIHKNKEIKVSEHAIVRYFERVKGFNISEIEKEIISEDVKRMVKILGGTGTYPNEDFSVVMKDFTITTITK